MCLCPSVPVSVPVPVPVQIVDGKVFCVHGGLSPGLRTIDQMQILERVQEVPHQGPYCDLMWSDPEDVANWTVSPRGAGYLFGAKATREFCYTNGLSLICRAHQLVMEGYKFHFPEKSLVTVKHRIHAPLR